MNRKILALPTRILKRLVLPLCSKWVAELVDGRLSIYEQHIELNQYPFLDPKLEVSFPARAISVISQQQLQVCDCQVTTPSAPQPRAATGGKGA